MLVEPIVVVNSTRNIESNGLSCVSRVPLMNTACHNTVRGIVRPDQNGITYYCTGSTAVHLKICGTCMQWIELGNGYGNG